jgi:hypothetical protein
MVERVAAKELEQFEQAGGQDGPQILAAMVRLAIAEKDLENHDRQIDNAGDVDTYMRDKFTNQELYGWMVSQIATVYYQTYKLAYDLAKRVEKSYRYELGLDDSNFIQFGYWDSMKKGLLAGERLHHDLKRLETAYLAQNKREYELTKSISLALLDPVALIELKKTGECFFSLSEALFDLDHPGHYLRRIKTISLTIPCVTGPYTSVSATLTLQSNRIRKKTSTSPQYAWSGDFNDDHFNYNLGGIQSIATSNSQNDSGLFELNFRDERYLPFEGAGAISTWRIQLPKDFRQFDYDTISDIVMHMRYTAREGGEVLKEEAIEEIRSLLIEAPAEISLIRAFSAKHEFPSEWHQFLHPNARADHHNLNLDLSQKRFPFQFCDKTIGIKSMHVFLQLNEEWKAQNDFEYDDGEQLLSIVLKNSEGDRPYADPDPEFTVRGSLIENVPSVIAFREKDQSPGVWLIEIPGADDNTETRRGIPRELSLFPENPLRLNPNAIDDLIIVCYYSVTE